MRFQVQSMPSHVMELPRKIVIGEKNISDIGTFLVGLSNPKKVSIVSGDQLRKIAFKKVASSLSDSEIKNFWHLSKTNELAFVKRPLEQKRKDKADLMVGMGG